jgi:hypothetical protein
VGALLRMPLCQLLRNLHRLVTLGAPVPLCPPHVITMLQSPWGRSCMCWVVVIPSFRLPVCSSSTARRARGIKWHLCQERDMLWLPVPSGATSTFSGELLVAPKLRLPSSSTTRRPTSGALWRSYLLLALITAPVLWGQGPLGRGALRFDPACIAAYQVL